MHPYSAPPTPLCIPISSFHPLHGRHASDLGELHLSPPGLLFLTERYGTASGFYSLPPFSIVPSTVLAVGLPLTMAPMKFPGFRSQRLVHATVLNAVPPLPSFKPLWTNPSHLLTSPVAKCCVCTLTGCPTDTSSSTDFHHGRFCWVRELARCILGCDKANGENVRCSSRSPLRDSAAVR